MKFLFMLIVIVSFSDPGNGTNYSKQSFNTVNKSGPRRYDPIEEDPFRTRFLHIPDADGHYQTVDLFQKDPRARKTTIADVTFYLYTQNNPQSPDIIPASMFEALTKSRFEPSRQNVFLSHGWNNNVNSTVNTIIRPVILAHNNVNLFVVDWSRPANLFYISAKNAVPTIGKFVGDFINRMMKTYNIDADKFNLIGHSLGAHLVGCAGARVHGLVNSIVGLDPAAPLYTVSNTANRIDESDGRFVQIIHTNGRLLGFSSALGHADYYPNGGRSQPGCGLDFAGTCAHARAYELYAESLGTGTFYSRRCRSIHSFTNGECDRNHRSLMGGYYVDRSALGDYYLTTSSNSPFDSSQG